LHAGAAGFAFLRQFFGCKRCAVDAVAPGCRADDVHRIPLTFGRGRRRFADLDDADAHRVYERIPLVGAIEIHFACDRRDAERVAVVADATHDAVDEVLDARVLERTEPEGVQRTDGSRAHCKDIALDAADAGGR